MDGFWRRSQLSSRSRTIEQHWHPEPLWYRRTRYIITTNARAVVIVGPRAVSRAAPSTPQLYDSSPPPLRPRRCVTATAQTSAVVLVHFQFERLPRYILACPFATVVDSPDHPSFHRSHNRSRRPTYTPLNTRQIAVPVTPRLCPVSIYDDQSFCRPPCRRRACASVFFVGRRSGPFSHRCGPPTLGRELRFLRCAGLPVPRPPIGARPLCVHVLYTRCPTFPLYHKLVW